MSKAHNKNNTNAEDKKNTQEDTKSNATMDNQTASEEENRELKTQADQAMKEVSPEDGETKVLKPDDEEGVTEGQVLLTKDEIDELRKKAEEHDSLLDQFLRTRAEFLNYQKRMRKELEASARFAVQDLILDLFPELDNFERAVKHAEDANDLEKFIEGIKLIENQLFKALGKYGVTPIETIGKDFDPKLHEAVVEEENNELPHHTVTGEFQRGYFLKERVIRPAKVKVSKRSVDQDVSEAKPDGADEADEDSASS